jgi:hypothetical protein
VKKLLAILILICTVSLASASSWKDKVGITEATTPDGTEFVPLQKTVATVTTDHWLALDTVKAWLTTLTYVWTGDHSWSGTTTFTGTVNLPAVTVLPAIRGDINLSTTALAANTCRTETDTATGAEVGDRIIGNPSVSPKALVGYGALATDGMVIYSYTTTDTINFDVCNKSDASITPSALNITWMIIK